MADLVSLFPDFTNGTTTNMETSLSSENMTGNNTETTTRKHFDLYDSPTRGTLPTIIFVSILSVIGTVGNFHVLVVFIFKVRVRSTYCTYVISLAFIDLLVSIIHMPGEILDLYYPYNLWNSITCRLFRFNNFALSTASVLVLLVVAVDRYKRVCRTLSSQWSVSFSRKLVIGCVFLGLLIASPALTLFGIRTVELNYTTTVKTCFINDEFKDSYYVVAWIGFVYFLFIIGSIVLIFTYVSIGYHIKKQMIERAYLTRKISSIIIGKAETDNEELDVNEESNYSVVSEDLQGDAKVGEISDITDCNQNGREHNDYTTYKASDNNRNQEVFVIPNTGREETPGVGQINISKTNTTVNTNKQTSTKTSSRESNKVTKIVSLITVIFVLCHVPYLSFGIILGIHPDFKLYLDDTEIALYRLAMRLVLVNNICNAFVYGIFDKRFMELCKGMYKWCILFRNMSSAENVDSKLNSVNSYV